MNPRPQTCRTNAHHQNPTYECPPNEDPPNEDLPNEDPPNEDSPNEDPPNTDPQMEVRHTKTHTPTVGTLPEPEAVKQQPTAQRDRQTPPKQQSAERTLAKWPTNTHNQKQNRPNHTPAAAGHRLNQNPVNETHAHR
ncbi:hypothetical protein BS47DRAFT_1360543 [Hydnum rufescens UP504]|uniref:Uncharacterized protein n=1 Tax=Hydnum rufescens UP504 TaxID=1448309 RepID=A0A9P6B1Y2_9AGAM|nr:hypothetical protein BS47DRAFT_1360543 [Hydnum rufescens UP504]